MCASLIFTQIPICLFIIYFLYLIFKGHALVTPNDMRKTADTDETDAHVSKTWIMLDSEQVPHATIIHEDKKMC